MPVFVYTHSPLHSDCARPIDCQNIGGPARVRAIVAESKMTRMMTAHERSQLRGRSAQHT